METDFIAKDEQHSFGDDLLSPRVFEEKEIRRAGLSESIKVQLSNIAQNHNQIDLSPLRNELQQNADKGGGSINLFSLNTSYWSNLAQFASDQEDASLNSSMTAMEKIRSFEKQNCLGNGPSIEGNERRSVSVIHGGGSKNVRSSCQNGCEKSKKLSFEE